MACLTLSEKLDQLDVRYQEMTQELSTPEVVSDSARFQKLAKQHADALSDRRIPPSPPIKLTQLDSGAVWLEWLCGTAALGCACP